MGCFHRPVSAGGVLRQDKKKKRSRAIKNEYELVGVIKCEKREDEQRIIV